MDFFFLQAFNLGDTDMLKVSSIHEGLPCFLVVARFLTLGRALALLYSQGTPTHAASAWTDHSG